MSGKVTPKKIKQATKKEAFVPEQEEDAVELAAFLEAERRAEIEEFLLRNSKKSKIRVF